MLTIVRCYDDLIDTTLSDKAEDTLTKFKYLGIIFDDFKKTSFNDFQNPNVIFRRCLKSDVDSIEYLQKIEEAISNLIGNNKLMLKDSNQKLNSKFINRLTSSNPADFLSTISELRVADNLLQLFGPNNFLYEQGSKKDRKADFKVIRNGKEFSLELRSIMKGTTKEKIESIFNEVCVDILKKLKDREQNCNIIIRLDTSNLCVNEDNQIDIESSVKYLISYFDKLNFLRIAGIQAKIDFSNIRSINLKDFDSNEKVSKILEGQAFSSFINVDENDQMSKKIIDNWLENISIADLASCPYEFFEIVGNLDKSCVSISPIDIDTSDDIVVPGSVASNMDKESYLRQVKSAIKDKHESGQRTEGKPSIIILDTFSWHFNYFEYDGYLSLREFVMEELKKYPEISGVIFFHELIIGDTRYGFFHGRYVANSFCDPSIRVTVDELQSLSILKKYNDPLIENALILKSDDLYSVQLTKIKKLIEIQPTVSLDDDKKIILSNFYDFLGNDSIDIHTLDSINEIVMEYCHDSDPVGTELGFSSDSDESLLDLTYDTVRSLATSCLFRLLLQRNTKNNLILAEQMAKDIHTIVRESASLNLKFLHNVDKSKGLQLAKKTLDDNERVRGNLRPFLRYLFSIDKDNCLELCKIAVNKQNNIPSERDQILQYVTDLLCYGALKLKISSYNNFLVELIMKKTYKGKVKESIAFCLSKELYILDNTLSPRIIDIFHKLLLNSPESNRASISFRLLYPLTKNDTSYLPEINNFLDTLSYELYPEYSYKVEIIDYLSKFCLEFPKNAALYLIRIVNLNSHLLTNSIYLGKIFETVKKLLIESLSEEEKNSLIDILEQMVESDYVNLNFPEVKQFLDKMKK